MAWSDPLVACRHYLLAHPALAGIPVATTVPDPYLEPGPGGTPYSVRLPDPDAEPDLFVRLMRTGERRRTIVHRDTLLTIECWAKAGEQAASELMERVYQAVDDWTLVPIHDGWVGGPYYQPDPHTGIDRYVATVIARHRTD